MTTTGHRVESARSLMSESDLPTHEATRLLESATGRSRLGLAVDDEVSSKAASLFAILVARRRRGEPLQYIEGSAQFGPIELAVDPRVLIPRPETEQLWELVVARLASRPPRVVVDLGTGSGNLAIACKMSFPRATVHAVDVSPQALDVAADNVARAGVDVTLHRGDLFSALPAELGGTIDLLISNPPYVATPDRDALPVEVRDHEPALALFGGWDGLSVLSRIIAEAPAWLSPGGVLACEIGEGQGSATAALAVAMEPQIIKDLSGKDRFLIAQKGME